MTNNKQIRLFIDYNLGIKKKIMKENDLEDVACGKIGF